MLSFPRFALLLVIACGLVGCKKNMFLAVNHDYADTVTVSKYAPLYINWRDADLAEAICRLTIPSLQIDMPGLSSTDHLLIEEPEYGSRVEHRIDIVCQDPTDGTYHFDYATVVVGSPSLQMLANGQAGPNVIDVPHYGKIELEFDGENIAGLRCYLNSPIINSAWPGIEVQVPGTYTLDPNFSAIGQDAALLLHCIDENNTQVEGTHLVIRSVGPTASVSVNGRTVYYGFDPQVYYQDDVELSFSGTNLDGLTCYLGGNLPGLNVPPGREVQVPSSLTLTRPFQSPGQIALLTFECFDETQTSALRIFPIRILAKDALVNFTINGQWVPYLGVPWENTLEFQLSGVVTPDLSCFLYNGISQVQQVQVPSIVSIPSPFTARDQTASFSVRCLDTQGVIAVHGGWTVIVHSY